MHPDGLLRPFVRRADSPTARTNRAWPRTAQTCERLQIALGFFLFRLKLLPLFYAGPAAAHRPRRASPRTRVRLRRPIRRLGRRRPNDRRSFSASALISAARLFRLAATSSIADLAAASAAFEDASSATARDATANSSGPTKSIPPQTKRVASRDQQISAIRRIVTPLTCFSFAMPAGTRGCTASRASCPKRTAPAPLDVDGQRGNRP